MNNEMKNAEEGRSEVQDKSEDSESDKISIKRPKKRGKKLIMNVSLTKYQVVRKTATQFFGWKLSRKDDDENWDVFWTDGAVEPEKLAKMKLHQKINHFPGMFALAKKNHLAKNLNRMRKRLPNEYEFYPKTWMIPAELSDIRMHASLGKNNIYIVKPEASCQGKGIFLTKNFDDFTYENRYVAQEYIKNPLLIDGLKFDLRIYVLVAGCDPLRIYLHKEGLGRFATEAYVLPNSTNLSNPCMHLTNYAINKNSDNFVFNDNSENDGIGHKRSMTSIFKYLDDIGHDTQKLKKEIQNMIIKTLLAVQSSLAHTYKACQPDDPSNSMCFEILGLDVMLDSSLKPWLLEVNHSPSFTTDSPLDWKIKFDVISEALSLMNLTSNNRKLIETKRKSDIFKRSLASASEKKEWKLQEISKAQSKRDNWENKHLGGYIKIYPAENQKDYEKTVEIAREVYEDSIGIKKNNREEPARPKTQTVRVRTPNKDKLNIEHRNSSHRSISNHFDLANQDRANTPSVYARLCSPVKRIAKREASPGPFIYMDRSYYNQSPLRLNPAYELLNRSQSPAALKKAPVDDLNERKAMENIKRYHIASNNPMKIRSVNLNTSIESEPTNLAEIPQINKEVLSKLKIADHELKKRHVNTFRNPAYWKRIQSLY